MLDKEALAESERIVGTGPLIGSMGIRTFTKAEQRQLRDRFLREKGQLLPGVGDLGSSESEPEFPIESPQKECTWKKNLKR